ncbi:MAG: LAGLIDADG family homing endonuclease [Hadesarchaea archaeon]|nr:LAGLIDADG family homing endonuclease [Hadesarchaea archaeon]
MEKLDGILSVPRKKWQKSAIKLAQIGDLGAFRNTLYGLNITFGHPPPPKRLKHFYRFLSRQEPRDEHFMQTPARNESALHEEAELPRTGEALGATIHTDTSKEQVYSAKLKTPWTEEEEATLQALYPIGEREKLIATFKNRTWRGVKLKAHRLGLKFPKSKCRLSRKEIEELYKQVGASHAAEALGVAPATFYNWLIKNKIGPLRKMPNPNLCTSEDLLYVLGVLKGDGLVYVGKNSRHVVRLGTVSEEFAKSFAGTLKRIGLHPWVYSYGPLPHSKRQRVHVVNAASKRFAEWYKNLKTKEIKNMIGENLALAVAFVRGFYESEGCFYLKRGKYPIVEIYNTDVQLLMLVKELILLLGVPIDFRLYRKPTEKWKACWRLYKGGGEALNLVKLLKPCIKTQPSNLSRLDVDKRRYWDAINNRQPS